jgi:DNA-binding NarL/FixJ family response regulator
MQATAISPHRSAIVISLDDARERRANRQPRRPDRVRVLAAGGHALTRAAMRRLLAEAPGIEVLGSSDFARPDVVLIDVGAGNPADTVARMARDPETSRAHILLLAEPGWRGELPPAADGAVFKDASPAELVAALRTLALDEN